jgi:CheY-like chemotaxis protein
MAIERLPREARAMLTTSPSLLITDDDLAFRETLQDVLEPLGVRTLLAADGEEALDIVHREEVHLVLLDMHMPRLTGLETLRLVKQFKAILPCILLSAELDEWIVEQARLARAFSVLCKPVTRRQITGVVAQALQRTYNWHVRIRTGRSER